MTAPEGWYPDPAGSGGLRWYDGARWTEHVVAPHAPAADPTTPDGEPLAGWGRRLGAYLIDGVVVSILATLLGLPWVVQVVDAYLDYLDRIRTMAAPEQPLAIYEDLIGPLAILALIQLVVGLVYHAGQWRWRAASLGMVLVGIRIRTWDSPSRTLGSGRILKRFALFYGVGFLAIVPLLGLLASAYFWLAALWPLWDARRQGLHDKVAGTVVVRAPRT